MDKIKEILVWLLNLTFFSASGGYGIYVWLMDPKFQHRLTWIFTISLAAIFCLGIMIQIIVAKHNKPTEGV